MRGALIKRIAPRSKKAIAAFMGGGAALVAWALMLLSSIPDVEWTHYSPHTVTQATAGLLALVGGVAAGWGWVAMLEAVNEKRHNLLTALVTFATCIFAFAAWGAAVGGGIGLLASIWATVGHLAQTLI